MKITFKNIIILVGSLFLSLLLIGFLLFLGDYISKDKKYNEYKTKVELTLKENAELNRQVADYVVLAEKDAKEKQDLLDKLAEKKVQIIEKEKIIYINGKLDVPTDYDTLKRNYLILGENYELVKAMYASLLQQSVKDSNTIQEGLEKIDKLTKENNDLTVLLQDNVQKPTSLFAQSIMLGAGIDISNTKYYHAGYLATVIDKIQFEIILSYPFTVSALIGVKL